MRRARLAAVRNNRRNVPDGNYAGSEHDAHDSPRLSHQLICDQTRVSHDRPVSGPEVLGQLLVVIEPPEGRRGEYDEPRAGLSQSPQFLQRGDGVRGRAPVQSVALGERYASAPIYGQTSPPFFLINEDVS